MGTDSTQISDERPAKLALNYGVDADGTLHPMGYAVAVCFLEIHQEGHRERNLFMRTCSEHNIQGARLATLYESLAARKMTNLKVIFIALDQELFSIDAVNAALEDKQAAAELIKLIGSARGNAAQKPNKPGDAEGWINYDVQADFRIQSIASVVSEDTKPTKPKIRQSRRRKRGQEASH